MADHGIGAAVTVISTIYNAYQHIILNRDEALELAKRCEQFQIKFSEVSVDNGLITKEAADQAVGHLKSFQEKIDAWPVGNQKIDKTHGWHRRLPELTAQFCKEVYYQKRIARDIAEMQNKITECYREFQITVDAKLLHGQDALAEQSQKNFDRMASLVHAVLSSDITASTISQIQGSDQSKISELDVREAIQVIRKEVGQPETEELHQKSLILQTIHQGLSHDDPRLENYRRVLLDRQDATKRLLPLKTLRSEVEKVKGEDPVAAGLDHDKWKGLWLGRDEVIIKTFRNIIVTKDIDLRRFDREAEIWTKLYEADG